MLHVRSLNVWPIGYRLCEAFLSLCFYFWLLGQAALVVVLHYAGLVHRPFRLSRLSRVTFCAFGTGWMVSSSSTFKVYRSFVDVLGNPASNEKPLRQRGGKSAVL